MDKLVPSALPLPALRTVMVVDDEAAVQRSLKAILEQNFKVVVCADGAAAIKFASEHSGEVYAAFVDYAMPAMNGNVVCSALRALDSRISLIGFTGNESAAFPEPLFAKLLKKHTSPDHVLKVATLAVRSSEESRNP